jgi:hypothetical protein
VVSVDDPWLGEVRQVYDADRFPERHLDLVPGFAHGLNLLDPAMNPDAGPVRILVETFVRAHLPAS